MSVQEKYIVLIMKHTRLRIHKSKENDNIAHLNKESMFNNYFF